MRLQIAHSPIAWEHVLFKDVAVKVSNLEVYYRAVSFYLQEHPDLLVDLLKVALDSHASMSLWKGMQSVAQGGAAALSWISRRSANIAAGRK